jgi:hypothetical protein
MELERVGTSKRSLHAARNASPALPSAFDMATRPLDHSKSRSARPSRRQSNARRRVSSLEPTRAEQIRRLAREASRRRKAQQTKAEKQISIELDDLNRSRAALEAQRKKLDIERRNLQALILQLYNP